MNDKTFTEALDDLKKTLRVDLVEPIANSPRTVPYCLAFLCVLALCAAALIAAGVPVT